MIPRLLLFILCSGFVNTQQAQVNYTVTQFTAGDGLVSTEISHLFQDTRHYVWIGHTGGVSRYDGYRFEDFLYTANRQLGKTWCIAEDDAHHIWIGTENGLFLFNGDTLRYITFDKEPTAVYALAFDASGALWIGTNEGPSYLTKEALLQTVSTCRLALHQNILPAWKKKFPVPTLVFKISAGKDGAVYFGDGYTIHRYWKGNLSFVWESIGQIDQLHGILAVNKDTVYICSGYQGLQAIENDVRRISPLKTGRGIDLAEKNGQLFFYASEGMYAVNRVTLEASLLFKLPIEMTEWGSCAMQDNENNFWIGTHEQLSYARRNFFTSVQQPTLDGFNELYTIKQLQDGSLVCGANHGSIFRAEKGSRIFTPWKKVFTKAHVADIIQEPNGNLWFSSGFQGITVLDKEKSHQYTKKDGLRDNTNFVFITTPRGERFAAGDDGVSQVIQDADGQLHFKNHRFLTGSTDYVIIKSGIALSGGGLLLGSNHGLLVLQNDTLLPAVISNTAHRKYNVTDIRQDVTGHIWISTIGDGILIATIDKRNTLRITHQLNKQSGLPALIYLQLLVDRNNIVWAAGYNGITRIEQTSDNGFFISNFCKQQGFSLAPFHTVKMMQDATGLIWIATTSGLMYFNPAAIDHAPLPSLQLNDITLLQQQSENGNTHQAGKLPNGIHLNHRSNSIAFWYTGIYFSDPHAVTYAYRLLGSDSLWVDAGNNRQVSFRHLPPGSYTFQVKAAAGTNRWSDMVSYHFVITPPFWKRWWFIAVCAFTVIVIIYLIIKRRIGIIQRRGEERAAVQQLVSDNLQYRLDIQQVAMERQQAQLEALYNKQKATEAMLQSMRLQMSPHFLFNALNSIQQMILAGDENIATRALSKFARLLRLVLIHSDKEKITLREELQILKLYIDLESFRFTDRFKFAITCDPAIDQDETKVPALLIQPFVENAIWHGLMHKEGQRLLQVHFTEELNGTLMCMIEDNGIGRQASLSIKSAAGYENEHTGKGIAVATERLKVFNEHSGWGNSLEITDMTDKEGNASGTKVVVKFMA